MTNGFRRLPEIRQGKRRSRVEERRRGSKGLQALASEAADYSKQSIATGSAALEKLLAANSLDQAVGVQAAYPARHMRAYVGQVTKVG